MGVWLGMVSRGCSAGLAYMNIVHDLSKWVGCLAEALDTPLQSFHLLPHQCPLLLALSLTNSGYSLTPLAVRETSRYIFQVLLCCK